MKRYWILFFLSVIILVHLSCKKVFTKDESLPLKQVDVKTVLKNHTRGLDYRISGVLEVNAELIIEPGVEIGMEPGAELIITDSAVMRAVGKGGEKIVFKSSEPEQSWSGIEVRSLQPAVFDHVVVEGASDRGWYRGSLEVSENANVVLENTEILGGGSSSAISLDNGAVCALKPGCNFHFNFAPIQLDLDARLTISSGSSFTGNSKDVMCLRNRYSNSIFVNSEFTLEKSILPYLVSGNIYLNQGKLKVEDGVNLQFVPGVGIFCNNSLSVLDISGTKSGGIILENERGVWQPKTPTWAGIVVNVGRAYLRYVTISDVTNSYWGAVTVQGYGDLDMANCVIRNFSGSKCSILKIGSMARVNAGIGSMNSFVKSPGYCFY